jgi:hypothetical protein
LKLKSAKGNFLSQDDFLLHVRLNAIKPSCEYEAILRSISGLRLMIIFLKCISCMFLCSRPFSYVILLRRSGPHSTSAVHAEHCSAVERKQHENAVHSFANSKCRLGEKRIGQRFARRTYWRQAFSVVLHISNSPPYPTRVFPQPGSSLNPCILHDRSVRKSSAKKFITFFYNVNAECSARSSGLIAPNSADSRKETVSS